MQWMEFWICISNSAPWWLMIQEVCLHAVTFMLWPQSHPQQYQLGSYPRDLRASLDAVEKWKISLPGIEPHIPLEWFHSCRYNQQCCFTKSFWRKLTENKECVEFILEINWNVPYAIRHITLNQDLLILWCKISFFFIGSYIMCFLITCDLQNASYYPMSSVIALLAI